MVKQIPLDSVQEFRVVTNGMTAEYGRAAGGVVNVATKSGTNQFHGTAYEFNRISALASNTYNNAANDITKPVFTRNQFGYSIGGPIKKNKLFFFNNTEWVRDAAKAPANTRRSSIPRFFPLYQCEHASLLFTVRKAALGSDTTGNAHQLSAWFYARYTSIGSSLDCSNTGPGLLQRA